MKFALFGINVGPCADPGAALRVARAAEVGGLESVWTGEHVVLPDPQVPPSPAPPELPFLDPAVALAFIAAGTRTIRLGTGIIILPQRNPVVLAKELASVDVVSGGRLIFGLGIGYLEPEFAAIGASFEDKGARALDYLGAMLALWTEPRPAYAGRFVRFSGVQAFPRPVQRPHPPIVFGGHSPAALRRAAAHGNGWYGFRLDLDATGRHLAQLATASTARPAALGRLEISITPAAPVDCATVEAYARLGVDRLIYFEPTGREERVLDLVRRVADVKRQYEATR